MSRWKGFLPKNALVMARKVLRPEATESVALEIEAPTETPPETPIDKPAAVSPSPKISRPKLLVYLEAALQSGEAELLTRMMAAIQLTGSDYVVESGDFPQAATDFVVGIGLSGKREGRLLALRPDGVLLPSLEQIRNDPAQKKSAWEKLQKLQVLIKGIV